jgi:hypothetical protein
VLIGGALKRRERSDPDADDEISGKKRSHPSACLPRIEESATAFCIRVGSVEGVRIDALLRNIRGGWMRKGIQLGGPRSTTSRSLSTNTFSFLV